VNGLLLLQEQSLLLPVQSMSYGIINTTHNLLGLLNAL